VVATRSTRRGKPEGRTRKHNKPSDKFIVRRRKSGKKR
jgi:large subunit ribosomal protein L2